ncbi:probable calcium-binding protein CML29 [Gastrolobium bilobum]|uniref:probable calcium-binding protein CML29 n=1 Tax=Gastrolobium bilobum TaxID=150636 RepID=UPI002AB165D2|nr:probable calcium-binding protein CML29 [Gastrolobium bilobum]
MAQVGNSLSAEMETLNHVLSLVEAFRAFDADNDGFITDAELGGILGSVGYNASEQEVKAMMKQGDKNKDGLLSINEFLEMNTKDLETGNLANVLSTAFEALDEDGNESLTGEDLHEVMENLGLELSLEKCHNIVTSLDLDGDGAVSLDEFRVIVDSLRDI